MPSISVESNFKALELAAAAVRKLTGEVVAQTALKSINSTLESIYPQAIDLMIGGINMSEADVRQRLRINSANDSARPQGSIVAAKHDSRGTTLASYGVKVETRPVNWSNERIAALGVPIGPWPLWTLRKGDSKRGIPAGEKFAGFSASVKRGVRTSFPTANTYATLIPVRGRLLPVKINRSVKGKGRLGAALYGPSVLQLFRHNLGVLAARALLELDSKFAADLNSEVDRVLK
jgi:hypothetical protein